MVWKKWMSFFLAAALLLTVADAQEVLTYAAEMMEMTREETVETDGEGGAIAETEGASVPEGSAEENENVEVSEGAVAEMEEAVASEGSGAETEDAAASEGASAETEETEVSDRTKEELEETAAQGADISTQEPGIPRPGRMRDAREINRSASYLRYCCGENENVSALSLSGENGEIPGENDGSGTDEAMGNSIGSEADGNASPMLAPEEAEVLGVTQSVHSVHVTYLLVDASVITEPLTPTEIFEQFPEAVLGGSYASASVYDPDPAGDVLMAIVDTRNLNGAAGAISATFSDNNEADPADYSDLIGYDEEMGVITIPKSFYFDENGKEISRELQAELVIPISPDEDPYVEISVFMDSTDASVTLVGDQEITVPALDATVTIPLTTPETAANFDIKNTWIYLNDSYAPYLSEEYYFDFETGELTLAVSPLSLYSIYVVYGEPNVLVETAVMAASISELAAIPSDLWTIKVDGTLKKGEAYTFSGEVKYASANNSEGTTIQNIWNQIGTAESRAFSNLKSYTLYYDSDSTMRSFYNYVNTNGSGYTDSTGKYSGVELVNNTSGKLMCFLAQMPKEETILTGDSGTKIRNAMAYTYLPMRCIENLSSAIGNITSSKSVSGGTVFYGNSSLKMRVMYLGSDYAVVAVIGPRCSTVSQGACGVYKVKVEQMKKIGVVHMTKYANTGVPAVSVKAHVQSYGWQSARSNGALAGSTGYSKRIEAIQLSLPGSVSGGIQYQAHVQSIGWQDWKSNGQTAGTTGEGLRMEAVKIQLTGAAANLYDVYYRSHIQTYGWNNPNSVAVPDNPSYSGGVIYLGWKKNGEISGSTGLGKRVEALEVVLVPKNSGTPKTLQNAVYGLYTNSSCTTLAARLTSDSLGMADYEYTFGSGETQKNFWLKEITAPSGYTLSTQVTPITLTTANGGGNPYAVSVLDYQYGYAKIKKISANTSISGMMPANYSLSGAVYKIYTTNANAQNNTNAVATLTTGSDGTTGTAQLAPGTYYVKEITASKGYRLDSSIRTVTVSTNQTAVVTSYEPPQNGKMYVKKVSGDTGLTNGNSCYSLAGAEYHVYKTRTDAVNQTNAAAVLTTTASGTSNTVTLPIGTYYVKEKKAGTGYFLDTNIYTVNVTDGGTASFTSKEMPQNDPVTIVLTKKQAPVDWDSSFLPLSGAQFTIRYYAGYYDTLAALPAAPTRSWVIETKPEERGGVIHYVTKLEKAYQVAGDDFYYAGGDSSADPVLPLGTITIEETKAPDGYTLADGFFQDGAGNTADGIYLAKITSVSSGIFLDGTNSASNGNYPISGSVKVTKLAETEDERNGRGLAGAEFTLYQWNGTEYVELYRLIDQNDGTYTSGTLYYSAENEGRFRVMETKAPEGFCVNGEPFDFTLSRDTLLHEKTVKNRYSVKYSFVKLDRDHGTMVPDCSFELRDSTGAVIDRWVTDGEMPHVVTGRMKEGERYTLVETTARRGFHPEPAYEFTAEAKAETITITSQNTPFRGNLYITKSSGTASTYGTVYQLYSTREAAGAETCSFRGKTFYLMEEAGVDAGGSVVFSDLEIFDEAFLPYEYLFLEKSAPDGAVLLAEPVYVGVIPMSVQDYEPGGSDNYEYRDGVYLVYDLDYEIRNDQVFRMPHTGALNGSQLQLWIPAAMAALAILFSFFVTKRNQQR